MNNKPLTFIFFGIVGSGKGTQVELLEKYLKENKISDDVFSSSIGSEYRRIVESKSYTGRLIETTMTKGHLQPDFLTISLFTNILVSSMEENTTFIADGFARTVSQAEAFEAIIKFYNRESVHVVYIELDKEEAKKRMILRGRADDNEEGIARRFDEYVNNVIPAMNYFKDKAGYTMHVINGKQSIESVHADIIKSLNF
jgi:adenylate kinase